MPWTTSLAERNVFGNLVEAAGGLLPLMICTSRDCSLTSQGCAARFIIDVTASIPESQVPGKGIHCDFQSVIASKGEAATIREIFQLRDANDPVCWWRLL
jgi:hypothetical protein